MDRSHVLLVVVEPGARLPPMVDDERRARPEHVVVVAGGTMRVDELAFRTTQRVKTLRASGGLIVRAVVIVGTRTPQSSRILLCRALVAHLSRIDGAELVLAADTPSAVTIRDDLLELAGDLLDLARENQVSIRVRFDASDLDSGIWPRGEGRALDAASNK